MSNTPLTRRDLLISSAATLAATALSRTTLAQITTTSTNPEPRTTPAQLPITNYQLPVTSPNTPTLPFKTIDGVKIFHLIAEEVDHEFAPGLRAKCWGYNGSVPGPTIEATDGDRVRFYVTNKLPESTTVHWHSLLLPHGMDGVGGLNQRAIAPGETFKYEFTLHQVGTAMYHSHHDEMTQIALGLTGMFIIHPNPAKHYDNPQPPVDRDFAIMLHEWRIDAGASRPNPMEMTDFNVLTMNGKCYPATAPLVVKKGERVRIRLGNLGPMEHHPIHLHGYHFLLTETDGGRLPPSAQWPSATVLVPVGSTRTIEFTADYEGDWAMHCHMTHHVMNQMGHDSPNMTGIGDTKDFDKRVRKLIPGYMTMGNNGMADMGDMKMILPPNSIAMVNSPGKYDSITMGGMFTLLKVRDNLTSYEDPGWYDAPAETIARPASTEDLHRDGITLQT